MVLTLRSERDVETKLISPLFRDILGYPEDSLHWAEPVSIVLGREKKTKEADLVAYHEGQPVVVVEAKKPTEPVQSGIGQVDSYAFALRSPYSVVTNGRQFVLRGYYSFNSRINVVQEAASAFGSRRDPGSVRSRPRDPAACPAESRLRACRAHHRSTASAIRVT